MAGMFSPRRAEVPPAATPTRAPSNLAIPPDPSSPLRRREGPAMRLARNVWNVFISVMLGTMIGLIGHEFVGDAAARLWPDQAIVAELVRALCWTIGIAATGLLFFSYYLDDTGG
ncbi:MAG: hypothetical protein BGN99_17330 [Alphaproteobacteria bacterium 65-37]|jgi:hypothetical protein|nr:MAG: hypothetical protein BGN99_17330 [Alphaproteobacteria bacterium 65-37]